MAPAMTAPFLEECLSVLARTPATLDTLLRDLPDAWTAATEGPGTWSPYVRLFRKIVRSAKDGQPMTDCDFGRAQARFDGILATEALPSSLVGPVLFCALA